MRARRREAGNAAIEFALVLPVLLLLGLGVIDYGWYFYVDLAASNAAREGARAATTVAGACPNAGAVTAAVNAANASLAPSRVGAYATVTCSCATVAGSTDPAFTVAVDVVFPRITGTSIVPMPSGAGVGAGFVKVHAQSTMRGQ